MAGIFGGQNFGSFRFINARTYIWVWACACTSNIIIIKPTIKNIKDFIFNLPFAKLNCCRIFLVYSVYIYLNIWFRCFLILHTSIMNIMYKNVFNEMSLYIIILIYINGPKSNGNKIMFGFLIKTLWMSLTSYSGLYTSQYILWTYLW